MTVLIIIIQFCITHTYIYFGVLFYTIQTLQNKGKNVTQN